MRKMRRSFVALVLVMVLGLANVAFAQEPELHPDVFVALRETAYNFGWGVEWDSQNREIILTDPNGILTAISINDPHIFVENGVSYISWAAAMQLFSVEIPQIDPADTVRAFMDNLQSLDIWGAMMLLTPQMQTYLDINLSILAPRGNLLNWYFVETLAGHGIDAQFDVFAVASYHTNGNAIQAITVDQNGLIAGFFTLEFDFVPMPPPEGASYTVEPIIIGEGTPWELDGLLTVPEGASVENPVPAVVLVHGSGAQNMDSSIFNYNRPFFDIADYLSSNGIAVLRYNKRTFSHGAALAQAYGNDVTVWEEVVEDALLAAELLQADGRFSEIFVLGHSQGGMLAPRIAEEGDLAGAILMASTPRPIYEVVFAQNMQTLEDMAADGILPAEVIDDIVASVLEELEIARNLGNLSLDELRETIVFGILPAVHVLSLTQSLPIPFILQNSTPVLILHGHRDFQTTTEADFQIFFDELNHLDHTTIIAYDGLNHLMMHAARQYGPLVIDIMEYAIAGTVDGQVLRDIVEWINRVTS